MFSGKRAIVCAAAVVVGGFVLGERALGANPRTWNGSIGNWGTSSNWVGPNVPDTNTESAIINSGAVTLDMDPAISGLQLDDGALIGASHTLNASTLTWTGGVINNATITIAGSASIGATPSPNKFVVLDSSTLNLNGGATQADFNNGPYNVNVFHLSGGAVINNSGTYAITRNSSITTDSNSRFNNSGTLKEASGNGTSLVTGVVNTGTISANTGALWIDLFGGETSSGIFNAENYRTLKLGSIGGHTIASGATFTGGGTFEFAGGVTVNGTPTFSGPVVVSGGVTFTNTVTINNTLSVTGGAMFTPSTDVTATGLNWAGGSMSGTGATTISGDAVIGDATLDQRTLVLEGSLNQFNANVSLSDGATIITHGDTRIADGVSITNFDNTAEVYVVSYSTLNKSSGSGTSVIENLTNDGGLTTPQGILDVTMATGKISNGYFTASGLRLTVYNLFNTFRARLTLARMSLAEALQMNGLGLSLWQWMYSSIAPIRSLTL